jgi:hypothetical protein
MMSTHSNRLRNGVKELVRTDDTILEDLHMVASDVIAVLDKLAKRIVRKLKPGQAVRVYDEDSRKEYGQKGSDLRCWFSESYVTKTKGTCLRLYDAENEWSVALDCLLEVFDDFDPESVEGRRRVNKAQGRRRGRRTRAEMTDRDNTPDVDTQWPSTPPETVFEPEEDGEEYDFSSADWGEFYENE